MNTETKDKQHSFLFSVGDNVLFTDNKGDTVYVTIVRREIGVVDNVYAIHLIGMPYSLAVPCYESLLRPIPHTKSQMRNKLRLVNDNQ